MEMHSKKPGKGKNPHDPAGKLTRVQEYYYGNGFLLAAKTIDKPEKHGYGPGGKGKGWGNIDPLKDVTFYHQDAMGSVVMLTGHNGQVVERYEYDVYGVAYNGKFDHGLAGMGGNPYGFTGKRYEPETGIYSFAFRDYNPWSMQWMIEDPVKDGMNWYQYCGSDPVNWVDLLGLCVDREEYYTPTVGVPFAGFHYEFLPEPVTEDTNQQDVRDRIAENAASLAGSEYVWGGHQLGGVDCSGTVYYSYTEAGVEVDRLTAQGYHNIMTEIEREEIQPGDIITYNNTNQNNQVTHVQVYIGTATDRYGNIVNDAVINAGSEETGTYIVSLETYNSWGATQHLTPGYGTLLIESEEVN